MRSRLSSMITLWYRLTYPLYARFWRLVPLTTVGVKVIVVDPDGRVLLVRTRYHQWWALPGGGVHRRETPEAAAVRELREETGIRVEPGALSFGGLLSNFREGKSDYIVVYTASLPRAIMPEPGIEIADARWFAPDDAPGDVSPATRRRLAEWRAGQVMTGMW